MGTIMDATILHHVGIMLLVLWILNYFNCCYSIAYILCFIYLCLVHQVYVLKLRKRVQFEEKKESNRRRVLSDSETVRWLNYTVEKIWPICMEEIVSQKMLLPVIPWFLQKYKPWTAREVSIQNLYLGRSPPTFTDMRVVQQSSGDDHLVLELGMNFLTADDMSAILGVKLRKRLGFGMLAKLHLLGLHVEGKVLVGIKFRRGWPFISRLRVCFVGPPYFQMTVKPIFTRGLDVTELPGIAGWIDNLLALAFEQTLVEPNMLVVDVEKFVSPQQESWFSIDAKEPIAHVTVEVLEAAEMNPSDLNGLADPYVKGQLGPYRFRTKTQKKTLTPKWHEEFKIPICTWDSPNMLAIEVCDKDHLFDDMMGDCSINLNELRDGQRHDMWLPLQNIKMGRLHLAFTVLEVSGKGPETLYDLEAPDGDDKSVPFPVDSSFMGEKSQRVADKFEPIDIDGQAETGVWIHQPGSEVAQVWEPRKGKSRKRDSSNLNGSFKSIARASSQNDGSSSTDESTDCNKQHTKDRVMKGLKKMGSAFRRSPRAAEEKSRPLGETEQSPRNGTQYYNIRASNAKQSGVKLIIDETEVAPLKKPKDDAKELLEECGSNSPRQVPIKDAAKGILKQAEKSARGLRYALSGKASRKSKVDSGSSVADKDGLVDDDDSSENESVSPVTDLPGSTVSPPMKSTNK